METRLHRRRITSSVGLWPYDRVFLVRLRLLGRLSTLGRLVLYALLCVLTATTAVADQTPSDPDSSSSSPAVSGESIAARRFEERTQTTMRWWRDRDQFRDVVMEAARSIDPEIAGRARWVQSQWQRGILPDTPAALQNNLSDASPAEAIEILLEAGEFVAARVAMEESFSTIEFESVAARVSLIFESRFPIYARLAVQRESVTDLIAFMDYASANKKMALCRDDLIGRFDEEPSLPTSAQTWTDEQRAEAMCVMLLRRGKQQQAEQIAREFDQQTKKFSDSESDADATTESHHSLNRVVRMVTSQWEALAQESARQAEPFTRRLSGEKPDKKNHPNSKHLLAQDEHIRLWADVLIAATRSGNQPLRVQAIRALSRTFPQPPSPVYETLRWRALLIHGEVDTAIDLLADTAPREASAIAVRTSRHERGLELLGYDLSGLEVSLETWVDQAIHQQRSVPDKVLSSGQGSSPTDKVMDCLSLMLIALDIGRDDIAYRIATQLSDSRLFVKTRPGHEVLLASHYVMAMLALTSKTQWVFELAAPEKPSLLSRLSLRLAARAVDPVSEETLYYLNWFIYQRRPEWSAQQCFITACEIARANNDDIRRHREWIDLLGEHLKSGNSAGDLDVQNKVDAYNLSEADIPTAEQWETLFDRHKRSDLVRALVRGQSTAGDLQARLRLLSTHARDLPTPPSPEDFEAIWRELIQEPERVLSRRLRDDGLLAFDVVLQQLLIARRDGDEKLIQDLESQLRVMAASPSTDMRQEMADALASAGMWDLADDLYQSLLLLTAFESDETLALMDIARAYNKFMLRRTTTEAAEEGNAAEATMTLLPPDIIAQRREAVRWYDLAFAGTLAASDYREINYVILPQLILRNRLELILQVPRESLSQDEQREVREIFETLLRFEPIDIHSAESMLPRIRDLGMVKDAEQWINRIVDSGLAHMSKFPMDATAANNVAWSAVRNHARLDDALTLSRRAVSLEPDSAVFRDTLAEILAQQGEVDEAIELERASLMDDPGQWHLHLQIERFESMRNSDAGQ